MDLLPAKMKPVTDFLLKLSQDDNFYPAVILGCFVLFVTYYFLKVRTLPPGPLGLPLIGYLPMITSKKRPEVILKLCRDFKSDIVSIRVYGKLIVYLNSFKLVKECFVKRADLVDRIDGAFFQILEDGYTGIVGNSGAAWKEHRRFSLYVMRDFGMGKVRAEEMIQHETEMVMKEFRSLGSRSFNPQTLVNSAVSNIICSMIFGKRYEYDNEEFVYSLQCMNDLVLRMGGSATLLLRRKWLRPLMSRKMAELQHFYQGFAQFARDAVAEHIQQYDGSLNDLIDAYLKECYEQNKSPTSAFSEKNLNFLIYDMFLAGSETTYTTLRWALMYMASYPEIQHKVYEELKENLGDRLPQMSDKKSTPFTEATLSEVQRVNTLLPFGLLHTNSNQDFEIEGYKIPKGTAIAANLHAVHRDPKIWPNPDNFDPAGNFLRDGKVVNLEYLIPFSIGRRSCAGEALARMELYIFFASWMLNFEVKFAGHKANLEGMHRSVYQPESFEIRMIPRAHVRK